MMARASCVRLAVVAMVALFGASAALQDTGKVLRGGAELGAAELKSFHTPALALPSLLRRTTVPTCPIRNFTPPTHEPSTTSAAWRARRLVRTQFENPPRGGGGQPL